MAFLFGVRCVSPSVSSYRTSILIDANWCCSNKVNAFFLFFIILGDNCHNSVHWMHVDLCSPYFRSFSLLVKVTNVASHMNHSDC